MKYAKYKIEHHKHDEYYNILEFKNFAEEPKEKCGLLCYYHNMIYHRRLIDTQYEIWYNEIEINKSRSLILLPNTRNILEYLETYDTLGFNNFSSKRNKTNLIDIKFNFF